MKIDNLSANIIKIALFIDKSQPGFISELWIEKKDKDLIKSSLPSKEDLPKLLIQTQQQIEDLTDIRRKDYLDEVFKSLSYQIEISADEYVSFSEFSKHAYGFEISRVTHQEICAIEAEIKRLENSVGLSREDIYKRHYIDTDKIISDFNKNILTVKDRLPDFITNFPDLGFTIDLTSNKPWSAFNSHIAPFSSKLILNTDVPVSDISLHHFAFHEAYAGHHSELSQKDKLLLEGHGEHGLVIMFSPQTFISEAIAEGVYSIFSNKQDDLDYQMAWQYNRLIFSLQNLAAHLFFDDKKTIEGVNEDLKDYAISEKDREGVLNFSTHPLFGRYAPVYYSAYNFFIEIYQNTTSQKDFLKALFTEPCTPSSLMKRFKSNY